MLLPAGSIVLVMSLESTRTFAIVLISGLSFFIFLSIRYQI